MNFILIMLILVTKRLQINKKDEKVFFEFMIILREKKY